MSRETKPTFEEVRQFYQELSENSQQTPSSRISNFRRVNPQSPIEIIRPDLQLGDERPNAIAQPNNMALAQRTLKELATPDLDYQPLCIVYSDIDVDFELKSG